MEDMDSARRAGGVIWLVAGFIVTVAWMVAVPSDVPGPVTWAVLGALVLGAAVQIGSTHPTRRWWAGRLAGVVIGLELMGAVGDRFGLLGPPGAPGVSWGDWAHFRAETAQLVPWMSWVQSAAVTATVAELTLGLLLLAGPQWRWVGKVTAGLFSVYLVAMIAGTGLGSALEYGVPVLIGGALLTSARGAKPRKGTGAVPHRMSKPLQRRGSRVG